MAKFKCKTLNLSANRYETPKGNHYWFPKDIAVEVTDKDDIEFFRRCPNFEEIGIFETVKQILTPEREEIATPNPDKPRDTRRGKLHLKKEI